MVEPGVEYFLSHWEVDLFWGPAAYPINVMEVLGTKAVRWPGATWGIDRMMGFQIVDDCYLEQEDYDDFIRDPSHFLMTKVYPRRHEKLAGLAKMDFSNFVEFGHYASMAQSVSISRAASTLSGHSWRSIGSSMSPRRVSPSMS